MAQVTFKPEEALVLVAFLMRFRDEDTLSIEHPAEKLSLIDLCGMLESQVPELLGNPNYQRDLDAARALVESDDWE